MLWLANLWTLDRLLSFNVFINVTVIVTQFYEEKKTKIKWMSKIYFFLYDFAYTWNSDADCSIILIISASLNLELIFSSQRTAWCWWCIWIGCSLSKSISSSSSSSSSTSWSISSSVQLIIKWFKCGGKLVGGFGIGGIGRISSSLFIP